MPCFTTLQLFLHFLSLHFFVLSKVFINNNINSFNLIDRSDLSMALGISTQHLEKRCFIYSQSERGFRSVQDYCH